MHRDHEVEALPHVLLTQELADGRLVPFVGEPRQVEMFGVIAHSLPKAPFQHARQLAIAEHGNPRVRARRVQDEHVLLGLRPGVRHRRTEGHHHRDREPGGNERAAGAPAHQKSIAPVSLKKRGVRIVSGWSHGPLGT